MPALRIFFFRVTVFSLNGKEIELLVPLLVCATDAKRSLSKAARPVDHLGREADVWKARHGVSAHSSLRRLCFPSCWLSLDAGR